MSLQLGGSGPRAFVALLLTAGLVAGSAGGQTPAAGPTLAFSGQTIQAQGMTAGGAVVWFGIGREVREYAETLSDHQDVTVADAQGQATLQVKPAGPRRPKSSLPGTCSSWFIHAGWRSGAW
jgi:hypothetical protein